MGLIKRDLVSSTVQPISSTYSLFEKVNISNLGHTGCYVWDFTAHCLTKKLFWAFISLD